MIRGEPLSCIIPVRGGSKGIPGKNLRRIGRHTLLERAIKLAQAAPRVDRVLVTTDDPDMFEIARAHGAAAPGLRPAELATDRATTADAVRHLIEAAAIDSGYLLLLQATSPLRTLQDLDDLCARFEAGPEAPGIISLCALQGAHPGKLQKIEDGRVVSYLGVAAGRPRQGLEPLYELNGAFYLVSRQTFLETGSFQPEGALAFVMPSERSANLDTMTDWQILEAMVETGRWQVEEYD